MNVRSIACLVIVLAALPLQAHDPGQPDGNPVWSGGAELSYVATSGNSRTRTIGAGAELFYLPGSWEADFKAGYIDSESDGEQKARNFFTQLAARRAIFDRIDSYARLRYVRNRFAGIEHRMVSEVGAAYDVIDRDRMTLLVEAGGGYTREERLSGADRSFATAQTGTLWKWTITDNASISDEASLVLNLSDGDDWRFANVLAITAGINSVFAIKLSHSTSYLNDPVPGFSSTDTMTSAAIVAKF